MRRIILATTFAAVLPACETGSTTPVTSGFVPPGPVATPGVQAPVLHSISPALASVAMDVTITGSGFRADSEVLFGGVAATIVSISAGQIVVHPAAGSVDVNGAMPVVVRSAGIDSNALAFTLGQRGDAAPIAGVSARSVGSMATLPDGSAILADPTGGRLHRMDASGYVSAIADPAGELSSPARVAAGAGGTVLILDLGRASVLRFTPETGAFEAVSEMLPEWVDIAEAGSRVVALRADGSALDAVPPVTQPILLSSGCSNATHLSSAAGAFWVATQSGAICSIDSGTGESTIVQASWSIPGTVESLGTDGERLFIATGDAGTHAIYTLENGSVSSEVLGPMPSVVNGIAFAADHVVAGMGDGSVVLPLAENAGSRQMTASLDFASAVLGGSGRTWIATGYMPPQIVESLTDGRSRVVASGSTSDLWVSLTERDGELFVAEWFGGRILRIDPSTGSVTPVLEHGAEIRSFAAIPGGWLVSTPGSGVLARYDAQGARVASGDITAVPADAGQIAHTDGTVYIAAGAQVFGASANGGEAAPVADRAPVGATSVESLATDESGRFFAGESATGTIYEIHSNGASTLGLGSMVFDLSISGDGSVVVADMAAAPFRILP